MLPQMHVFLILRIEGLFYPLLFVYLLVYLDIVVLLLKRHHIHTHYCLLDFAHCNKHLESLE